MAEQDFIISIRTTADTAGIKRTEAELRGLGVQVESIKKAGVEAGSAMGSLAGRIAGTLAGGVGVGLIADQLRQYTTELNKATQEIDKQAAKVVELGAKWAEAAKEAISTEDVRKVAKAGMSEFDAIHKRIQQIATEDMPLLQQAGDTVTKALKFAFTGDPNVKGVYEDLNKELMKSLALDAELLKKEKIHAIELAESYKALFDELSAKPIDEAFAEIGRKITGLQTEQSQLNKGADDYLEEYNRINRELRLAETILERLLQLEKQRKREAQETAESKEADKEFFEKFPLPVPPGVRPIPGGREAGIGESQQLVNEVEQNRLDFERMVQLMGELRDAWR